MCYVRNIKIETKRLEEKKMFIHKKREVLKLYERDIDYKIDYYKARMFDYSNR